jgi:hypothetical protein
MGQRQQRIRKDTKIQIVQRIEAQTAAHVLQMVFGTLDHAQIRLN